MQADALPKLREIPIRGDVLQTLRLEKGWENPQRFCKHARISADRLAEIEQGGKKVFKKTLIRLAATLVAEWQALVDWETIDRENLAKPHGTRRPGPGKHGLLLSQAFDDAKEPLNIHEIMKIFSGLSGTGGKIVSVSVSEGKLTVGLEITDAAALRFAESYFEAPAEDGKLISARLLLDYRVAGLVIAGGGHGSKFKNWFMPRYQHFVSVARIKLGLDKIKDSDYPPYSDYYFYKYKNFENRLYQALAQGFQGRTSDPWFHYAGRAAIAVEFRPDRVGLMELVLRDARYASEIDWLDVNRAKRQPN